MGKTVVGALDFSEADEAVLARALDLAKAIGADLELVHVSDLPPADERDEIRQRCPRYARALEERPQRLLAAACALLEGRGVGVSSRLLQGDPCTALVAYTDRSKPAMLVIGTHQRVGLLRAVLGSIAQQVVSRANVPVMTCPRSA
jgi:nucleotide-binding universal stress UspA family protein